MAISEFNEKLAILITKHVGTMWCAYGFAILTFISLPDAIHGGIATLIQWIAQTFLQLVLLSIIMVGQDIQGRKSEARAQEDHDTIMAELAEIREIHSAITDMIVNQAACKYLHK